MSSIVALLQEMRGRLGMYVGSSSLTKLAAFVRGYDLASERVGRLSPDPFLPAFRERRGLENVADLIVVQRFLAPLAVRDLGAEVREDLLDFVWGSRDVAVERTIDAHIWKLRRKIELLAGEPRHIVSVPRLGYRFRRPDETRTFSQAVAV